MNSLFENDKLVIQANPDYYDYCHHLFLNKKTNKFELSNGGGQHMDEVYSGCYEINNNMLKLYFEFSEDIYSGTQSAINVTNTLLFEILGEKTPHFDGYCMHISNFKITFNKSPFAFDDSIRNATDYPLVFYTHLETVDCNVKLERLKRDETNSHTA